MRCAIPETFTTGSCSGWAGPASTTTRRNLIMGELKNCIKWLWCLLAHRKHHVLHSQVEYGGGSVWVCARCGQALFK